MAETPARFSAEEGAAVLDRLAVIMEAHHALSALHEIDPEDALAEVRGHLRDGMSLNEVLLLMQRALRSTGDGHARIVFDDRAARNVKRGQPDGRTEHLPFLVKMIGEQRGDPVVAIRANRAGFVDEEFPLLVAIDGVEIERWIDLISEFLPTGSPQFVRSRALRELRSLWRWRLPLNLPAQPELSVTLSSIDRSRQTTRVLRTQTGVPGRGEWPRTRSRMLDGNIGYLRIATMRTDDDQLEEIRRQFEWFRGAEGLIIDVRGNGGGQRDALHVVAAYLLPPDALPIVYTAVRPCLVDDRPTLSPRMVGRMVRRNLFPADSVRWTSAEQAAIEAFLRTFVPEVSSPDDRFGPWHFAQMSPGGQDRVFHFDAPVIVLMNADCFSATDVFLHAMGLLPNVTLMGQPSAGSSGAPLSWESGIPGVSIALSSIVSYRTDGTIFDNGQGEVPHVRIDPEPEFFIGRSDRVLDAAVARLDAAAAQLRERR